MTAKMSPIHPGEILLEEFMKPLGLTAYRVAKDIWVDPPRVHSIVSGKRSITADTAMRLGIYFGTEPEFWLNLQSDYELECVREEMEDPDILANIEPISSLHS